MGNVTAGRKSIYFNSDNCFTLKETLGIKALTFTWMPSWWKSEYGIIMGERYCMDFNYRIAMAVRMEKHIAGRYQAMQIGDICKEAAPIAPNWINATTAAAAGGTVIYSDDNFPTTRHLLETEIDKLELPADITKVFPYDETIRQAAAMNQKYGTQIKAHLFKNGISNDIIQLMGDSAMLEMMDETERFQKVLTYSKEMWELVMDYNFKKGSMPEIYMLLLCTVQLMGPKLYEEFFFKHDYEIIEKFYAHNQKFQLHHCGCFDEFIPIYRKIPHIDMIQIGFQSDPRLALEAFPEADVEYIYSPYKMLNMTSDQIREYTNVILERAKGEEHRFSIVAADIEVGTPDENIMVVYECCKNW